MKYGAFGALVAVYSTILFELVMAELSGADEGMCGRHV